MRSLLLLIFFATPQLYAKSPRWTASSQNFDVWVHRGGPPTDELLRQCEAMREEFQQAWNSSAASAQWRPRCQIVVHPSRASYQQAVGQGSGQTAGSSYVRFDRGRVVSRRIDLAPDARGGPSALAHEVAHVVLANCFQGQPPPRWVDEGLATLVDSAEKRRLHLRDCQYAVKSGTAIPLEELLQLQQCRSQEQMAAFYGQSLSLVSFLIAQKSPEHLITMIHKAMAQGYDRALRETYGIEDTVALERQWREFAGSPTPPASQVRFAALENSDLPPPQQAAGP